MTAIQDPLRRFVRRVVPAALLLGAAVAALAASPGGQYLAAYGTGRISLRRSGLQPVEFAPNLRFDFDGAPGDAAGTGTVIAYDAEGRTLIGEFPFTWTEGRGAVVNVVLDGEGFAGYLEGRIAEATGGSVSVALERISSKCRILDDGVGISVALKASGAATLGGGSTPSLKARIRAR